MMIGYYTLPNLVTLLSVAFSVLLCYFALNDLIPAAMLLMYAIGILDSVDGILARKMHAGLDELGKAFGRELDTAADLVNYSLGPIIVGLAFGYNTSWDWVIYGFYTLCLVIRLAFFNAYGVEKKEGTHYFIGFPSTYAVFILPGLFFADARLPAIFGAFLVRIVYLLMGLMFIVKIPVKDIRQSRFYLIVWGGIISPIFVIYWIYQLFT